MRTIEQYYSKVYDMTKIVIDGDERMFFNCTPYNEAIVHEYKDRCLIMFKYKGAETGIFNYPKEEEDFTEKINKIIWG